MKNRRLAALLVFALFAAGCAGPSRMAEKPTTLDEVNSALDGRTASIILLDGRRLTNLRMVRVDADTTFYRTYRHRAETEHVPTADVAQIRYRTDSGARDGLLIGILPGLALGLAGLAGDGIVGYSALVGGAALALAGGLVGAVLGNDLGKHEVIVYEHFFEERSR